MMSTSLSTSSSVMDVHLGSREVRELAPGQENQWDEFVTSSSSGTFCHLHGWRKVIEKVLGQRCYYLTARTGGRISGVFPISWVKNKVFGDCLVSLPLAV